MTQDEARQKAIKAGVESLKAGFANVFDHDEWLKALNLALNIFTEQCGFIKEAPTQGQGLEKGVYVVSIAKEKQLSLLLILRNLKAALSYKPTYI
ncbi:hypothetical protein [Bartonella sp. HY038]|uniref:hypothetical protein n=1 Tax=Bartonella sp. HY038 TaxID=2759660 RepID=UPI0015FA6D80|nr:hypothetical protein [Bartonella sp. HY038]